MPSFGKVSTLRLSTCDLRLQLLFNEVIKHFDCSIICGYRNQKDQNAAFDEGKSRVEFPHGKHNKMPSVAVDVAPYINGAISWDSRHCLYFGGYVMGVARMLGISIRWGGDWDSDNEAMTDQTLQDLVHFELI